MVTADDVLEAHRQTWTAHKSSYHEMKALSRPPVAIQFTCDALKILVNKEGVGAGTDADGMSFGSSETILLVCWPSTTQRLIKAALVDAECTPEALAKVVKMRDENADVWTLERVQKCCGPGPVLVTAWVFAAISYLEEMDRRGEKRCIPFEG